MSKKQKKDKNVVSIEEFEKKFSNANLLWDGDNHTKRNGKNIMIRGKKVYARSQRYKLFLEKGYSCSCCGKTGTHFTVDPFDSNSESNRGHLNLRAEDNSLICKYHIISKKNGGKDVMDNYKILCENCCNNINKLHQIPK